jgi:hypothetical protein
MSASAAMIATGLHPYFRNHPRFHVQVDFLPIRAYDFTRASGGQYAKLHC